MKQHNLRTVIVLLIIISAWSNASSAGVDSLQQEFPQDSIGCAHMISLSYQLSRNDPEKAIEWGEKALELALRLENKHLEANACNALGAVFQIVSDYGREMELYMQGLKAREVIGDSFLIAGSFISIGSAWFNQREYEKALANYHNGLVYVRASGKEMGIAKALSGIGIVYYQQNNLDSARVYYEAALALNQKIPYEAGAANNLRNIGLILDKKDQSDAALIYFEQSLEIRLRLADNAGIASSYNSIGDIHRARHDFLLAVAYYRKAIDYASPIRGHKWMMDSYESLAWSWESMGKSDSALNNFQRFMVLKDTIYRQENTARIARAETRFEYEQKLDARELQNEIEEMGRNRERVRERTIRGFIIAGAIVFLGFALVLFYRYQIKRRANVILESKVEERTEALKKTNKELNTFIYQSTHDLRSPLTSIKGLIGIAVAEEDPQSKARFLQMISERVDHLEGIHRNLIRAMEIRTNDVSSEWVSIPNLLESVFELIRTSPGFDEVKFVHETDPLMVFRTDDGLVRSMLEQILKNAIQFRDKAKSPMCKIDFVKGENGLKIHIADNGIGIQATEHERVFGMFVRGSIQSRGSGLGLYIADLITKKLDGKIILESKEGEGTTIEIDLPGSFENAAMN